MLNYQKLKKIDLIKTNQVESINTAVIISNFWNKPVVGRMGYLKSFQKKNLHGINSKFYLDSVNLEKKLAFHSSKIVLTTNQLKDYFEELYADSHNKITVIPNYVDSTLFKPKKTDKKFDLLFIGRLSEQKNIKTLLNAVINLDLKILFIGKGSLRNDIQQFRKDHDMKIDIMDTVPNKDLPFYMNCSSIFILPSAFEGNPKVLLEAMSCEMTVVGTKSPGIANIIKDSYNGYLCKPTFRDIRSIISKLANNIELQNKVKKNARSFILDNYDIDIILHKELELYNEIINRKN